MDKSLVAHQSDVAEFSNIIVGRRMVLLQYVWLPPELPPYDGENCVTRMSIQNILLNNHIYTYAIYILNYSTPSRLRSGSIARVQGL